MTLPASGPISLLDLQNEFGGTNPIALNEYYRGGPFVSTALTQIPTSGPLGIDVFHGISTAVFQGAPMLKQSTWGGKFSYVGGQWLWGEVAGQGYRYTSSDLKTRVTDLSNLATLMGSASESIVAGGMATSSTKLLAYVLSTSAANNAYICSSTDSGSTWVVASPAITSYPVYDHMYLIEGQVYGQHVLIAIGRTSSYTNTVTGKVYGGSTGIISIDDGVTWSSLLLPAITNTSSKMLYPAVHCGVYCQNYALAQGGDGLFVLGAADALYTATDGSSYTKRYAYDVETGSVVTSMSYDTAAFGNGIFVAGSNSVGRVVTSTDGSSFNQQSAIPNLAGVRALGFGNGYFVLVGTTTLSSPYNVAIWTSADGISWDYHQQISLTGVTAQRVVYAGGRFYVMASDGSAWAANA